MGQRGSLAHRPRALLSLGLSLFFSQQSTCPACPNSWSLSSSPALSVGPSVPGGGLCGHLCGTARLQLPWGSPRWISPFCAVHELLTQSLRLLHGQHLLEAHAGLMALERLRDDIYTQLHCSRLLDDQALGVVESYFGGVQELSNQLARQLWNIVGSSWKLVREDPALFVSAVRIIEREESIDDALLLGPHTHRFLPPGRPKAWRQRFYQVMQEAITAAHFQEAQGPGLGRHLATLQSDILAELCVVKDLMVQCCPPHYDILSVCTLMYHRGLTSHLQDILSRDLDKQEIFTLLNWVLHVYHSPEMMGHPDLLPEVDVSMLGPLVSPEVVDQMEKKYASVAEWMQRTLEVEFKEWFRDEEPEMDHLGFFQSALPVIVLQSIPPMQTPSLLPQSPHTQGPETHCFLRAPALPCWLQGLSPFPQNSRLPLGLVFLPSLFLRSPSSDPVLLFAQTLCPQLLLSPPSSSISTLHTGGVSLTELPKMPSSLKTALERTQKKACQLLLEELLVDLQVHMSPPVERACWMMIPCLLSHFKLATFKSIEHLVTNRYVRALMEKKMVCRSAEERSQFATQLLRDASQLRELFQNLGLDEKEQTLKVIFALQELIRLKDPALLSLEVLGFMTKYPDIRYDEHVSTLLDLRGDVSKEIRNMVLEMMAQNPQSPPENYQSIFSSILVPAPELPFCLRKGKCA
uniref:Exocyst complex component 3 like 1 n=1 Tax=Pelusios castaneus TaxID=367368 RepID=A0A8C8SDT6_9SAUR